MYVTRYGLISALLMACALGVPAEAEPPDLGATPLYAEEDGFAADEWGMTVYSYVFSDIFAPPEEFGQVLEEGELLFAYLLDGDEATDVAVSAFSVGNPFEASIGIVGYEDDIEPPSYDLMMYQQPSQYGYNDPSHQTVFNYFDTNDPFAVLEPQEWSLVWYVAEAPDWTLGPGTGTGGGVSDNQSVPVPLPAPGVLCLFALAAVTGRARARR
ncbi:MAG: hypothetical protein SYC29_04540 [Planctomycetota bacterium]|nr:hypothetical protein [Planctomycetota bacterium]